MNLMINVEKETINLLKTTSILKKEKIEGTLEKPPQEEFGDLASNISFSLAKKLKQPPKKIAEDIVKEIKIPKDSFFTKVEAKVGYVNFFFNYPKLSELTLQSILKEKENYGSSTIGMKKRVMVEFSQPNPVHPMHIGHARTTFLGDAVSNTLAFNGFNVVRTNLMNDIGLQVAKLVTACSLWAKNKKPDIKPDVWLWKYYIKFHEESNKNPDLEEKARETLRKFENERNKKTIEFWNKIVRWCVDGFKETYKNTNVEFDVYFYESDFRESGKKIVEKGLKKGVFFRSDEGTVVADLEKRGLPSCVVLRSDGTGLYSTSDLGMTVHKFEKYKLDRSIWVVSSEQKMYFKQLFKMLELIGYPWTKECNHLGFELVRLSEGRMSSREGKAVMLDEVVDKLAKLTLKEVEKRNPNIKAKEKKDIAKKIALGALRYSILKVELDKTMTFDWKRMLSFEGNTGPYLQYAHTRCNGILKKAEKWKTNFTNESITHSEKKLFKKLMEFPNSVLEVGKDLKPHYLCNYAYDLADVFNEFYHSSPVLKAENEKIRDFRLTLVEATKITLKNVLQLLGIDAPEFM